MILHIEFTDGNIKHYDIKPLLYRFPIFNDLNQNKLFSLVQVDSGGYGVIWNEFIDLACNELWYNGYLPEGS